MEITQSDLARVPTC